MTRRPLLAALISISALAVATGAGAQQVVHDPTAYARMIEDARLALRQLEALQAEVAQGQRLLESLNDATDLARLATELDSPQARRPLPSLQSLQAAGSGDLSALGTLEARARAIQSALGPLPQGSSTGREGEADHRSTLARESARATRDLVVSEVLDAAADQRLQGLDTLVRSLDGATTARGVLELQARLLAEQAMLQNEQLRLEGLTIQREAEAALELQRQRQRAETARAARMAQYQRRFR